MKGKNRPRINLKRYLLFLHLFVVCYFGFFVVGYVRYSVKSDTWKITTFAPLVSPIDFHDEFWPPDEAKERLEFYFNKNFSYSLDTGNRRRIPDRFVKFWNHTEIPPLPEILSPSKTECGAETKYVILVNTAEQHYEQRLSIRSTWGNKDFLRPLKVELVFVVGQSLNVSEDVRVKEEARTHGDMVVADFVDDYRNLTLKSLLGVKWASLNCRNALHMFHADDDVFLDIKGLLDDFASQTKETTADVVYCGLKLQKWAKVTRRGRWSSTVAVYGRLYYPPYCNGPCYAMSMRAIQTLYEATKYTPNDMTVDDVVVTGILREKVGLPLNMMRKGRCTLLHQTSNISDAMRQMWLKG